jgi:predicted oxidoreductase
MRTITYPRVELAASPIALGCMYFGGGPGEEGASPAVRQRAAAALTNALELGWNFFDHADIYCRGRSEVMFGALLRELVIDRESIIIQSKCGIRFAGDPQPGVPHRFDFSAGHIIASVEGSLRRLDTDYLDVLLLHRPDFLAEPAEIAAAFVKLQESGKVRAFGVSNHTPSQMALLQAALPMALVANQVEFSLMRTALLDGAMVTSQRAPTPATPADGTLDYHRLHGMVTQAWAPLAYGYLSGRPPKDAASRIVDGAKVVAALAAEFGVGAEAILLAWLMRHPAGVQPVVGTRDPVRLKSCHQALSVNLTREQWYTLLAAGRGVGLD